MSTMVKFTSISILLFFLQFAQVNAQISGYTIESFQDEYTELTSYQSIAILTDFDPFWNYEFQFGFSFPFFDSTYERVFYNHSSWGQFTEEQDEALLLMDSGGNFSYDNNLDTANLTSDVRFSQVNDGSQDAFVIQFTKARFFANPWEDSLDTYLNFQLWFFENGVMEVHFGEQHLDNTPIYAPGKGFYCYTTSGGLEDTTTTCGPRMGISHPLDSSNAMGLEGAYNDFEVINDVYATLTVLPPTGWIFRFKPTWVATSEPNSGLRKFEILPNPSNSFIELPFDNSEIRVFDIAGNLVVSEQLDGSRLDISNLQSGFYSVRVLTNKTHYLGRFIKQ